MPIEPSSRAGLTMTGNCRSCEKSSRPRKDLAKTGVWMPWNAKIFFAIALSCASIRPWVPEPVYFLPISSRKPAILKSAVSSSANDSVRLKTRSHSMLRERRAGSSACRRARASTGSWPSLVSASATSSSTSFLSSVRTTGDFSVGGGLLVALVHEHAVVEDDDLQFAHRVVRTCPRVRKFIASVVASAVTSTR